jgi:predicted GNAT family acetyltransferase
MKVITNSRIEEWHHITFSINHGNGLFSKLDCYLKLNSSRLQLDRAYVPEEFRQKGCFTKMFEGAEDFCIKNGYSIEVWPSINTPYLREFFIKRGYFVENDGYFVKENK